MTIELEPLFDGEKASDHPECSINHVPPRVALDLIANDVQALCMKMLMLTGDKDFASLAVDVRTFRDEETLPSRLFAGIHDAIIDCQALVMKNVSQKTPPTEEDVQGQQILSAIRNTPL